MLSSDSVTVSKEFTDYLGLTVEGFGFSSPLYKVSLPSGGESSASGTESPVFLVSQDKQTKATKFNFLTEEFEGKIEKSYSDPYSCGENGGTCADFTWDGTTMIPVERIVNSNDDIDVPVGYMMIRFPASALMQDWVPGMPNPSDKMWKNSTHLMVPHLNHAFLTDAAYVANFTAGKLLESGIVKIGAGLPGPTSIVTTDPGPAMVTKFFPYYLARFFSSVFCFSTGQCDAKGGHDSDCRF